MKKCKHFMAFVAVILVFAMTFSNVSIQADAAATAKAKSITVKNLPSNTLTLKKGKTFTIKTNVSKKKLKYATSNKKVVTVTKNGKIKAIKKGKANITISLKSNPKVKKVIHVTVGKPVAKVKLNKTSLILIKGKSSTLKATVTPAKPSNKKLIWKSSKPSVAKVSTTGKITGIKAGTATITVTAADGSGKKAACKVTVVNPTNVTSISMSDPQTAKVVLSSAQKLSASNFSAKAGTVINGRFPIKVQIESVTTKDNKTYTLKLGKKPLLDDKMKVRITVTGLYETGTVSREVSSPYTPKKKEDFTTYNCKQNVKTYKTLKFDSDGGYYTYTVANLPAGITYTKDDVLHYSIHFSGTPTKTGTTISTVTAKDEKGNITTMKITWNIYNDSVIAAAYKETYYNLLTSPTVKISSYISGPAGGSGQYTYAIVGNSYGLTINSKGLIEGTLNKAGTYRVNVKITDANNPQISLTTTSVTHVSNNSLSLSGTVKSKDGSVIYWAHIALIDKVTGETYSTRSGLQGEYSINAPAGTYDIEIEVGSDITYVYSLKLTKNITNKTLVSDTRKIKVRLNINNNDIDQLSSWTDEYGNDDNYGTGDYVFLAPGTYKLSANGIIYPGMSDFVATINATVTSKTTSLTAIVHNKPVDLTEGKGIQAIKGQRYKFIPKKTGTYYFYSISTDKSPTAVLYDANMEELTKSQYLRHNLTDNELDFYLSYECEAGKTYYVIVRGGSCSLYVSSTDPGTK